MRKCSMKFQMEAGWMVRGAIRRLLHQLKNDLLYHCPDANIEIEEVKGGLETSFFFRAQNVDENLVEGTKDFCERVRLHYQ